jgi:hypothetical protein
MKPVNVEPDLLVLQAASGPYDKMLSRKLEMSSRKHNPALSQYWLEVKPWQTITVHSNSKGKDIAI